MKKLVSSLGLASSLFFSSALYADSLLWISYIENGVGGSKFEVIFDETHDKFDDSNYTGSYRTDPLGNIKGGETYTCEYVNQSFTCSGFNQGSGANGSWTYGGKNPRNNEISLWGVVFIFNGKGEVYHKDWGLVGHLKTKIF